MKLSYLLPLFAFSALVGCATEYPGPRTEAASQVSVNAAGLQKHTAYPDDKLLVRVFIGKSGEAKEHGVVRLTQDIPSAEIRLDQGVEHIVWISSIEAHFGGFTSCGFYIPLNPSRGETFKIEYATRKSTCDVSVFRIGPQGETSKVMGESNVAGGTQFVVKPYVARKP